MQILKFVNGRQIGLRHHRLFNEYAKIFEHSEKIAIDVDKILNRKIPFSPPPLPKNHHEPFSFSYDYNSRNYQSTIPFHMLQCFKILINLNLLNASIMWVLKTMYQFNTVYVPSSVECPIQQK